MTGNKQNQYNPSSSPHDPFDDESLPVAAFRFISPACDNPLVALDWYPSINSLIDNIGRLVKRQ
jgi:hypothetical protein